MYCKYYVPRCVETHLDTRWRNNSRPTRPIHVHRVSNSDKKYQTRMK